MPSVPKDIIEWVLTSRTAYSSQSFSNFEIVFFGQRFKEGFRGGDPQSRQAELPALPDGN